MVNALGTAADPRIAVEARGYVVLRRAVPRAAVEAALRHIHLDVARRGLPAGTIGPWLWSAHWFPHL